MYTCVCVLSACVCRFVCRCVCVCVYLCVSVCDASLGRLRPLLTVAPPLHTPSSQRRVRTGAVNSIAGSIASFKNKIAKTEETVKRAEFMLAAGNTEGAYLLLLLDGRELSEVNDDEAKAAKDLMDAESLPSRGKGNLRRLCYGMIDDKKATVPRMHAAIADAEVKKAAAEKEVVEFDKGARRSAGVLHELAAQRFHAAVDTQLLANRAIDQVPHHPPPTPPT
jgi:hypothetical protein